MSDEVTRLRNLISVVQLKRRDFLKIKNQLKEQKIILDTCISKKNAYINTNNIVYDPVTVQQNNLEILDHFEELKKIQKEYDKLTHTISHLTNIISYINIEEQVSQVLSTTTATPSV